MRFPKNKSPLLYTIQAVVGTILEEAALAVVVLWVLPLVNIHISWWALALLMTALLAIATFTYIMGMRALRKGLSVDPGSIVGSEGVVVSPLKPSGYVRIHGELWKATSDSRVEAGEEVIVTRIDGLKVVVVPRERNAA